MVTCWERADLLALVCDVLLCRCHFPISIMGQWWRLIVSIPDLCPLSYFKRLTVLQGKSGRASGVFIICTHKCMCLFVLMLCVHKVSCSRTQHSDSSESRTSNPSISSVKLYQVSHRVCIYTQTKKKRPIFMALYLSIQLRCRNKNKNQNVYQT